MIQPEAKIWLYGGDWDDVVPLEHIEQSLAQLGLEPEGKHEPWFTRNVLSGFYQKYSHNVSFITVRGAGHIAVENKPDSVYQMFYNYIMNRPINTPVF